MMIAITTSIASEIATGAVTKPNAAGSAGSAPAGSLTRVMAESSDIQFRLHRASGFLRVDFDARQPCNHVPRRFGRHRFDLGPGSRNRVANPGFGSFNLGVELVGRG